MSESTQRKLSRNRPPRVQITYDVETGGAIEKKEIPFVVGIMADLSGYAAGNTNARDALTAQVKDRSFVEIDRDNFSAVMAKLKPTIAVADLPDARDSEKKVSYTLSFSSMDDFGPAALVSQLATDGDEGSIARLFEKRQAYRDLLTKLDGNDKLMKTLVDASKDGVDDLVTKTDAEIKALADAKKARHLETS